MAAKQQSGEQGTGKHPHKSTEEPFPHTKEAGTEQGRLERRQGSEGRSESHSASHSGSHSGSSHSGGSQESKLGGGGDDLKEREYRDKEGNVHHHTRTSSLMQDKR